jgi:predicted short-subunit dehydrogenase-like oxidoreductase (DUF2520 family)
MKISFIGSGNVAWHLSQALENAGHAVIEVFSRENRNATALTKQLYNAKVQKDLNFANSDAELFFLCVSDDAMEEVTRKLVLPEGSILVHTSGSKSLKDLNELVEVYSEIPQKTGVFYPLQTFSKVFHVNFEEVPICIETESEDVEKVLITLAQDISEVTYSVNSDERKVLHLAAVFACNFTNHLLGISQEILSHNNLEMKLLEPLIKETFKKALKSPKIFNVQTGPARRGDQKIINRHLLSLKEKPDYQRIYQVLTESISKKN